MRNNVPFDVAHALMDGGPQGEGEALAYAVVFAELESGKSFNWDTMELSNA